MTTTAKDWRTLDAGRELDIIVSERFALPTHVTYEASYNGGESSMFGSRFRGEVEAFIADYRRRMPDSDPARCEVVEWTHYPRVSTDIAAAWQVVALLATRGVFLMLEQCRSDEWDYSGSDGSTLNARKGEWLAHFQDVCTRGTGAGDTAPLAIARAALAATEAR